MPTLKPPLISEEMNRSIGLIIAWWAPLEIMFDRIFAVVSGMTRIQGFAVTGSLQWQPKKELLLRCLLMSRWPAGRADQVRSFIKRADEIAEFRKYAAHHIWTPDKNRAGAYIPYVFKIGAKKVRTIGVGKDQDDARLSVTPDELERWAHQAADLLAELKAFIDSVALEKTAASAAQAPTKDVDK